MSDQSTFPKFFKGIALFTPGGDLIYCIDPSKQSRWHLHLCVALQEILGLSEPPHFLIPCYTATIDRWFDPQTQQVKLEAETYAPVARYQHLLNAVFQCGDLLWSPRVDDLCNPMVIATYYEQFPQLWKNHDLVVQVPQQDSQATKKGNLSPLRLGNCLDDSVTLESHGSPSIDLPVSRSRRAQPPDTHGYVLRLFVSGNSALTERTLQTLHQLLEKSLGHPYTLKVVDVFKHPEQAEVDQISATPTLIKVWPKPVRRIVGALDDVDKILRLLDAVES
jgi:circadian clock protein KaiB